MIAPSGICAAAVSARPSDRRRTPVGAPGAHHPTANVSTAAAPTIAERIRLVYSITACPVVTDVIVPSHVGQSGQPSPESVSRTTAPLGTMTHIRASVTSARAAKPDGVRSGASRRSARTPQG